MDVLKELLADDKDIKAGVKQTVKGKDPIQWDDGLEKELKNMK